MGLTPSQRRNTLTSSLRVNPPASTWSSPTKGAQTSGSPPEAKPFHSSRPETGENAMYKMAEVVRFIHQKLVPEMRRYSHPVLGHSTISVGTITGGSKTNIVPDLCEATVDIRTVPTQTHRNSPSA